MSKAFRNQDFYCCELVFGLLKVQRAAIWIQDWAQITLLEMIIYLFLRYPGRCLSKGRILSCGSFNPIYRVSWTRFLLPELNFDYHKLDNFNYQLFLYNPPSEGLFLHVMLNTLKTWPDKVRHLFVKEYKDDIILNP